MTWICNARISSAMRGTVIVSSLTGGAQSGQRLSGGSGSTSSVFGVGGNAEIGPFCRMFGSVDALSAWNGRPRTALAADAARRLRYRKNATHAIKMSAPTSSPTMSATGGRLAPPSPPIIADGIDESGVLGVGRRPEDVDWRPDMSVWVGSSVWMFMAPRALSPRVLDGGGDLELLDDGAVFATSPSPGGGCVASIALCVMGDLGVESGGSTTGGDELGGPGVAPTGDERTWTAKRTWWRRAAARDEGKEEGSWKQREVITALFLASNPAWGVLNLSRDKLYNRIGWHQPLGVIMNDELSNWLGTYPADVILHFVG
ncbi:hypothetical protein C8J57DRAFT_1599284 [Mycena rebaudengoi]|nr:hypothetical protein C8J57DRAFT_1599284 [Mycena rebaudengoi]